MANTYQYEVPVLNGRFILVSEYKEMRMSHFVREFGILDADRQEILPLVIGYEMDSYEDAGDHLTIRFKIYPDGSRSYRVEIDPMNQTFKYEGETWPLSQFREKFSGK